MSTEESKPLLGSSEGECVNVNYGGLTNQDIKEESKKASTEEINNNEEVLELEKAGKSHWLVVLASFLCICVLDGTMYSFGSLLEPLVVSLRQPRSTVSIAGSLQVACSAFVGPLAAALVNKLGPRKVLMAGSVMATFGLVIASFSSSIVGILLGQSVLTGLGFGLMYIPGIVAVAEKFSGVERGGLALSLAVSGAGAGQVAMAPLVSLLVEEWGWRGSLRGLAVASLACAGVSLVLKQGKAERSSGESGDTSDEGDICTENRRPLIALVLGVKIANAEHLWVFLLVMLGDCFAVLALYIPYSYLGGVAELRGVEASLTALLISCIGLGSVAGRLLAGWLCDQPWLHPLHLTRAALALSIPLPFLLAWVDHTWMFCLLAALFGFLTGQWIAATSPLLVRLLGLNQLSKAFGVLTAIRGAASMASPPLAGVLVDLTGRPTIALQLSGACLAVAAGVFSFAVFIYNRRLRKHVMYEKI